MKVYVVTDSVGTALGVYSSRTAADQIEDRSWDCGLLPNAGRYLTGTAHVTEIELDAAPEGWPEEAAQ